MANDGPYLVQILKIMGAVSLTFPIYAPDAVVYPITTEDVVFLVNICQEANIPLIGYGIGTSLEGIPLL